MIFLIGGRGLVGSAFARLFDAQGRAYEILDRESYPRYIGQHCSLLINANGNSRKPLAREKPMEDFDASVRTVRSSLVDIRFERYIHLSSCDVYPDCTSPETTREDSPLPVTAQSPYGFHKYLAEQCVRHAAPDWLIFRFGGFVGPGLKKNAIFDILQGGPLWLDPQSELQFLSTDDAARLVMSLADSSVSREIFNLCGNGLVKLADVVSRSGKKVTVQPGSPVVRYDVSIEKVSRHVLVPSTAETVYRFIDQQVAAVRAR
jgi:nucleoside-diphosphate-sugar epimerase